MSMTVAQFKTALLKMYPTRDWDQMCARLVWNTVWLTTGIAESKMITYSSAIDAARASAIVKRLPGENMIAYVARAPLGAVHHWDYGKYGHDGVSLGDSTMLHTSDYAKNIAKWGTGGHLFIAPVLSYGLGTYLGWSLTFGKNKPIALVAPKIEENQRRVNAGGVSIRALPTSKSTKVGFFPPARVVSLLGHLKGERVDGIDEWAKYAEGKYCWMGGFEDSGVEGLKDLNPIPEPTPEPAPEPAPEPEPIPEPEVPKKPVDQPKPKRELGTIIGMGIVGLATIIISIIAWFNR